MNDSDLNEERLFSKSPRGIVAGEGNGLSADFLRKIETGLHDLSQPMTALLCLLEYGSGLEASVEMKQVMTWSTDATERLRATVIAMQQTVQQEGQRKIDELTTGQHGREPSYSQSNGDCGEH